MRWASAEPEWFRNLNWLDLEWLKKFDRGHVTGYVTSSSGRQSTKSHSQPRKVDANATQTRQFQQKKGFGLRRRSTKDAKKSKGRRRANIKYPADKQSSTREYRLSRCATKALIQKKIDV
jgi:Flp pilus assembly protein TadB